MTQSFEKILKEHGPSVYRFALGSTRDPETAADIYQETFLLLLEKKPWFTHKNQVRVWLMRTARFLIMRENRLHENTRTQPLYETNGSYTDESTLELYELTDALPEKLRDVTVMYYIEDMSVKDIAKTLDISVSAVKTRLKRARATLKTILEEE